MHVKSRVACSIAAVVLLLGACSDSSDDAPGATASPSADSSGKGKTAGSDAKSQRGKKTDKKASDKKGPSTGTDDPFTKDKSSDDPAATAYPAAGRYTYDQDGYEEFCQGAACDRHDLPDTQTVESSFKQRSDDAAVVVTDARSSDDRETKTTTSYARSNALITKVYSKVSYSGFEFANTYKPDPPVESLRFPLQEGNSWSGEWKADTSGDYRIDVEAFENIVTGTGTVKAYRLSTLTHFHGELEGTADVTVWVDPQTKAVVKTNGRLDVDSDFGSYHTKFETLLRSAPGYS